MCEIQAIEEYLNMHPEYYNEKLSLLPLMHSCECFDARNILSSKELKDHFCNVLKEKLLYFYYGKPSYPVGEKLEEYRTDLEYAPVCFIVDFKKVSIYKAFPFDSGAFVNKVYSDFIHRHMMIDDFKLPNDEKSIKMYISYMFENNDNYLQGNATKKEFTGEPNIDALVNMMTSNGTMKFDERARTIEIISKENIQLKDALKCIIMPENLLQDKTIDSFLKDNHIEIITYKTRQLVHPTKYYGQIFEKALNYIEIHKGIY